jgi:hydroxymethylpyrimidine pyrophosphatase-like HAD family hydrolase
MPIRLLAVDLDGTLLNSNSELSPRNRRALARAHASGVEIAVATGRRVHAARKYVDQIPCPVTLISSNGAMTTSASGEVFFRNFLCRAVALEALAATREFRPYAAVLFDLPGRGQIVMQDCAVTEGPLGWYQKNSADLVQLESNIEREFPLDPIQVLFGGPPALMEGIEPLVAASPAAPKVHMSWTKYLARNVSLLDVMTLGCSKGAALERWARHRGISPGEVMAIGDNHNDVEMLRFAACPIIMSNHSPGLATDTWNRTLSNDEDGVAAAIETHILA